MMGRVQKLLRPNIPDVSAKKRPPEKGYFWSNNTIFSVFFNMFLACLVPVIEFFLGQSGLLTVKGGTTLRENETPTGRKNLPNSI